MSDVLDKIKAVNAARKMAIDAIKQVNASVASIPFNDTAAINDLIDSESDRADQNLFYLNNKVPMVSSFIKLNTLGYLGALFSPIEPNARYRLVEDNPGTFLMPATPEEGDVIGLVDDGRIAGTINVTLDGNGYLIEGEPTVLLSGSTVNTHLYFFQGQWRRVVSSCVKLHDIGCKTNANGTIRVTNDTITQYITATPNDEMELPIHVPAGYEEGGALVSAVPRAFADETGFITSKPKSAMAGKPTVVTGVVDLGLGNVHTGKNTYIPYVDQTGKKWFYVITPVMYHATATVRPVVVLKTDTSCNASIVSTLEVGTEFGPAISTCATAYYMHDDVTARVYVSRIGPFSGGAGGKLFYFDLNVETGVCTTPTQIAYRTDTIRFADMLCKKVNGTVYLVVQGDTIKNGGSTQYGGSGGGVFTSNDGINFTLAFSTTSTISGRALAINTYEHASFPGGETIIFSLSTRSVSLPYGSTYTDTTSSFYSAVVYNTYLNGTLSTVRWYATDSTKFTTAYRNTIFVGGTSLSNYMLGNDFHVIEDSTYLKIFSNAGQYVFSKPTTGNAPTLVESHLFSTAKAGFNTYHEIGGGLYMTPLTPTKDLPSSLGFVQAPTTSTVTLSIGSFNLDSDVSTLPVDVELTHIRLI